MEYTLYLRKICLKFNFSINNFEMNQNFGDSMETYTIFRISINLLIF